MPRLWTETIETHRREVQDAILETTASLVAERGLLSVTMSEIAQQTGIGRATLYKYFPDVESVLSAWHERQIRNHLEHLARVRDTVGTTTDRLQALLEAYALIAHESGHNDSDLAAAMHRDPHVDHAERQLHDMIRGLLREAVSEGDVRDDVPVDDLTRFCLHALTAARALSSKRAVRRLVAVTLDGLRAS